MTFTDTSPSAAQVPPIAKRVPFERTFHGDTFVDDYAWLSDKENPETLDYLKAENAYTEAATAHLEKLRDTLFAETRRRTLETDFSLPTRKGGYWYYTRTVEGRQYGIHCRAAVVPGDDVPPSTEDGQALPGEEIMLDGNAAAEGHDFFSLGTVDVSPDGHWLAYSTDFEGDERYTLRVKDLRTGEVLSDEIKGISHGSAWSLDASVLFYVRVDDAWRPYQVWRHVVGTPESADVIVYEEADERFFVDMDLSRSERFILIGAGSKITNEYRYVPADDPTAEPVVIATRREGVDYHVEHHGDRFLILHNDGAEDFALAYTSVAEPGAWVPMIEHEAGTRLLTVDAFAGHLVLSLRRDGLTGLRVLPSDGGTGYDVTFPEDIYAVDIASNPEYDSSSVRLSYTSLVTPDSIYDCDVATGALTLRKRRPVLADESGRAFDPTDYEQHREWAIAEDGTRVPISLICRKDTPRDGSAPLVLYGYGSYEVSIDPYFSIPRLSLVDRGMVFAIAHIRGGGEMGRHWYEQGKMLTKRNTFTDFISCAQHLASVGWSRADRIVARGGSAGGLLMGAVANMAPEAFAGIVATVPFVDALTTILDPSIPLTVTEWDEWGNPLENVEFYNYIKSYTPYENVADRAYPPILAITSLNDTRVLYAEPAKWTARLRAVAPRARVLLKTEMEAGHGGPSGRYSAWREEAFTNAWILDRVGLG